MWVHVYQVYMHSFQRVLNSGHQPQFSSPASVRRATTTGWACSTIAATPPTASPPTTATSSPPWTGTTTRLRTAVPAPRPTAAAGGSTGGWNKALFASVLLAFFRARSSMLKSSFYCAITRIFSWIISIILCLSLKMSKTFKEGRNNWIMSDSNTLFIVIV